jgi:hypothetical protein
VKRLRIIMETLNNKQTTLLTNDQIRRLPVQEYITYEARRHPPTLKASCLQRDLFSFSEQDMIEHLMGPEVLALHELEMDKLPLGRDCKNALLRSAFQPLSNNDMDSFRDLKFFCERLYNCWSDPEGFTWEEFLCTYYNLMIEVRRLLLLGGDIESNPGPRRSWHRFDLDDEDRETIKYVLKHNLCEKRVRKLLLLSGDVEMNPGPVFSKLITKDRYNCLRSFAQLADGNCDPVCNVCKRPVGRCCCLTTLKATASASNLITAIIKLVRECTKGVAQIWPLSGLRTAGVECLETISDTAEEARDAMSELRDLVKGIPGIVNGILETQCGFLPVSIKTVLVFGATLLGLYIIYRTLGLAAEVIDVLLMLVTSVLAIPSEMVALFRSWLNHLTRPRAEMNTGIDIVDKWVPTLVPMFFSIVTCGLLGGLPCKELTPDLWMRRVADFPRACRGFGDVFTYVKTWFDKAIALVEERVWGIHSSGPGDTHPEVEQWMEEVTTAAKDMKTACDSRGKIERVAQLWIRGNTLLRRHQSSMSRETVEAYKRVLVLAAKVGEQARSVFSRTDGVRMVPQLLWFTGESQIGKTSMKYFLAAELLDCFDMADQVSDQVYSRCPEQEFYDGYNGQYVVIYDDWGQMKDSSNNPNLEFFELIRSVSNFPHPLHMADISQKANSFFTSKAIICSTNDMNIKVESLTYPDAVWNRFTMAFDVRIKKEYQLEMVANGKRIITLDKEKASADAPVIDGVKQSINLNVYEFYPFDAKSRRDPQFGSPMSFKEVAEKCKSDMRMRMARGTNLNSDIQKYASVIKSEKKEKYFAQINTGEDPVVTVGEIILHAQRILEVEDVVSELGTEATMILSELTIYQDKTDIEMIDYEEHFQTKEDLLAFLKKRPATKSDGLKRFAVKCEKAWKRAKDFTVQVKNRVLSPIWQAFKEWVSFMFREKKMWISAGLLALVGLGVYMKKDKNVAESHNPTSQPKHAKIGKFSRGKGMVVRRGECKAEIVEDVEVSTGENVTQMAADKAQQDMMMAVFKQQYMVCPVKNGVENASIGVLTVLKGGVAMMPYHFMMWLDAYKPDKIVLRNPNLTEGKEIAYSEFLNPANSCWITRENWGTGKQADVVYLNLSRCIPPGRDITKYFVTNEDLGRMTGTLQVSLSGPIVENKQIIMFVGTSDACARDSVDYDLPAVKIDGKVVQEEQTIYCRDLYEYRIPTKFGYCGQVLSLSSKMMARKLLGIHVAGSAYGVNWACAVSKDDIDLALEQYPRSAQISVPFGDREPIEKFLEGDFYPICELEGGPSEVSRSTIIRSSMYGKLKEATTKPARLRPFEINGEKKDPMMLGVRKMGKTPPSVDPIVLRVCVRDVLRMYKEPVKDELRVLTVEEACRGVPGDDLRNPMSAVTSPGYGWNKHGMKGKTYYMGKEGFDENAPGFPELRDRCHELVNAICRGDQVDIVGIDCLKDERRPIAKVDAGKTRIFTVLPMEFNIVFRMYFMEAIVSVRENRIRNSSCVGLNVWSNEWEQMFNYLKETGSNKAGDGDFGNLDGTLSDQVLWGVKDIYDEMYPENERDSNIREKLWSMLVYCVHLNRGKAYMVTHSLPSGVFGTSDFGSTYLAVIFRVLWMRMAPKKLATMKGFNTNVRMVFYGDDNVWSVTDEAAKFWNMGRLTEEFKSIGMEYTDAAKTGEVADFKSLYEIQFLKRTFKWSPILNRHTCPSDLMGRLETLNWTRNNSVTDPRTIESDNIQDVLKEVAAHGKEVFDEWAPKIVKVALESKVPSVFLEDFLHYHVPSDEVLIEGVKA